MTLNEYPPEIAGYKDDPVAASHYRRPERIVASLAILTLLFGVVSLFIFGFTEIAYVCMFLPLPFVIGLVLVKNRKRVLCKGCRQLMRVINFKWTVEQWKRRGRRSTGLIEGRDGYLYQAYCEGSRGSTYVISAIIQRWFTCDSCRIYFLGEKMVFDEFYKTKRRKKWKEAMECIKVDPLAITSGKVFRL
jgi:hypothetical protein